MPRESAAPTIVSKLAHRGKFLFVFKYFHRVRKLELKSGNYTLWGRVTSGMEFVDKIKRGSARNNGRVESPDEIIRMEIID